MHSLRSYCQGKPPPTHEWSVESAERKGTRAGWRLVPRGAAFGSPAGGMLSRRWHPTSGSPRPKSRTPPGIPFIQAGDPLGRGRRVCSVRSDHVGQRRAVAPGRGHLPRASRRAPAACGAGTEGRARREARAALRRPRGSPATPPARQEPRPRDTCCRCPAPPDPRPPSPRGLCSRVPPQGAWGEDVRRYIFFVRQMPLKWLLPLRFLRNPLVLLSVCQNLLAAPGSPLQSPHLNRDERGQGCEG